MEYLVFIADPPVVDARPDEFGLADAGLDRPRRLMPVADDEPVAILVKQRRPCKAIRVAVRTPEALVG